MLTNSQRQLVLAALLVGAAALSRAEEVKANSCCPLASDECSNICQGAVADCSSSQHSSGLHEVDCHCADLTHHQFYYVC